MARWFGGVEDFVDRIPRLASVLPQDWRVRRAATTLPPGIDQRYASLARLPDEWSERVIPATTIQGEFSSESYPETKVREYDIWNVLGGYENTPFRSKYFEGVEEADNGNLLIVRGLQRPGEHKYNTFDAVWQKDPATGDYVLVDVAETKEKASWKKHGAGIAKVAGLLAAGYGGLSALGAGAAGGAGAGAVGQGAWLGEGVASGIPAWDAVGAGAAAAGSGAGAGALPVLATEAAGQGAWLGEGIASGVPAWDAATATAPGVLTESAKGALLSNAGYGPGMSGVQTGVFDTILNATGSTTAAKIASDLAGGASWVADAAKTVFGGGGSNPASFFNGSPVWRDLLGLFGAGMQQWNIEKVAKDQRDWIDAKEAATRRRRAPVRGTAGALRVVGG